MIKLLKQHDFMWLDLLPGIRVKVRPTTVASMLVAREAVCKIYGDEDQT